MGSEKKKKKKQKKKRKKKKKKKKKNKKTKKKKNKAPQRRQPGAQRVTFTSSFSIAKDGKSSADSVRWAVMGD